MASKMDNVIKETERKDLESNYDNMNNDNEQSTDVYV